MQALFSNKKILIGIVVVIVAFIAYGIFFVSGNSTSSTGVSKTTVAGSAAQTSTSVDDGPGKEFVAQLLAIQSISFKLALFADPVFQNLIVSDSVLTEQPKGRDNPFAPFDAFGRAVTGTNDLGITQDKVTATATKPSTAKPATR